MKKQKRLAILGASGHGKVVADSALNSGWNVISFYDDKWPQITSVAEWPIIGDTDKLIKEKSLHDGVIIAIGNNDQRMRKIKLLKESGLLLLTITHPSAIISKYSSIKEGTVIFPGAVINAFSKIGKGCIINTSATVDHDCLISDGVHISPGANLGGEVTVGEKTWIGIGATIKNGIVIGKEVIIGAGAAVINDIDDYIICVGVPAKKINTKNHEE